ncbi:MAG: selenide, water dikinase SelD [Spirochaetia bacterium]|jgi:selenide,water dikinase|nr:selenide, water dikinase SelD [Spirochaetia bacterium]
MENIKQIELTKYTKFAGCGAKLGPGTLDKALCGLKQPEYPNLIADFKTSEDAGIYRISDDIALIQTIDFFPPIVNDPYIFGQIAAANALSDVYAMGGKPITALSVVGYPKDTLDMEHLRKIMDGGLNKLIEAGAALVGGHSLDDPELKFGYAITGIIHPDKVLRNNTLKPNETLILTKPLGTGTINTALRAGKASSAAIEESMKSMAFLNKTASEIIQKYPVSACTDITGFGLLGHACEMMSGTNTGLKINFSTINLFPDTMKYISEKYIPAGTGRNKRYRMSYIGNSDNISKDILYTLFDPQTSGGLLVAVPDEFSSEILDKLKKTGHTASVIGNTTNKAERIEITT